MWPFGPHRHYWSNHDCAPVNQDGKRVAAVYISKCYGCGSFRFDRVDGNGHASTKIVNADGKETM